MFNPERMGLIVKGQIAEILNSSPHKEVFEGKRPEAVKRFEVCTMLINRAKEAVTQTLEFTEAAADTYFKDSTDKGILFYIDDTEYEMSYFKGPDPDKPGITKEEFYLIKDGKEKISIQTFSYSDRNSPNLRLNGHISYSEDAPKFERRLYFGDIRAIEEGSRMINELELASYGLED